MGSATGSLTGSATGSLTGSATGTAEGVGSNAPEGKYPLHEKITDVGGIPEGRVVQTSSAKVYSVLVVGHSAQSLLKQYFVE
jgi:hypothetical protein